MLPKNAIYSWKMTKNFYFYSFLSHLTVQYAQIFTKTENKARAVAAVCAATARV
jgi:hypothetical protein